MKYSSVGTDGERSINMQSKQKKQCKNHAKYNKKLCKTMQNTTIAEPCKLRQKQCKTMENITVNYAKPCKIKHKTMQTASLSVIHICSQHMLREVKRDS